MFRKIKVDKKIQSLMFLKNKFAEIVKSGTKVFGITTSLNKDDLQKKLIGDLAKQLCTDKNKVIVVSPSDSESCEKGIEHNDTYDTLILRVLSKDDFIKKIEDLKTKYDVIIIMLPVVNVYAYSLECAKTCEKIFSVEKYQSTMYKDFEDMLYVMRENSIQLSGVIPYQ